MQSNTTQNTTQNTIQNTIQNKRQNKPSKPLIALLGITLGGALLSGCTMTGADNLRVHEVLMYGKANSHLAWVYGQLKGETSHLKLGAHTVELGPKLSSKLATAGSLSVNGKAVYKSKMTQKAPIAFKGNRLNDGQFQIEPQNAMLKALFYTDGQRWYKLSGTMGKVSAMPLNELVGVGELSNEEAHVLGQSLLGQGELLVGVVAGLTKDRQLNVEPAPVSRRATVLYLAGLDSTGTAMHSTSYTTAPTTPVAPAPVASPAPTKPTMNKQPAYRQLDSGTNARVDSPSVMVTRGIAGLNQMYALAYANQSSRPALPTASTSGTTYVGVFLGQRSSGGYGVRALGAKVNGDELTVTMEVSEPNKGDIVTMALTSPWTIVAVEGKYSSVRVVDQNGRSLD